MENTIFFGDNLPILQQMKTESVDLIYIDPPFNTGKRQSRTQIKTERSETGDRYGFQRQPLPDHPPGQPRLRRYLR